MNIISLDVGTSSMRAIVYDENGQKKAEKYHEYHAEFPAPGYVEQNPDTWKEAAIDCLKSISEYFSNISPDAIAVTSQRSSLIPMDKSGLPLYNSIMWQDKRTIPHCEWLIKEYTLESLYRKTGLRTNPYFVLPKILWLTENERSIFNKSHKLIGVQDLIIHFLTGEYKTDHSQGCRTLLMNIENFKWDKELLDIANISEERLPELLPPGSVAGGLVDDIARNVNLPSGIPVIMCGGDQQNAAVALGVLKPGVAEANTGTGSFVISAVDNPTFDKNARVLCQASAIAGQWIMEAGIFNTGAIYRWFKEQFYPELRDVELPYDIMNQYAEQVPPGSKGVIMLPHFEGSAAPYWNPKAKGMFFNLSLGTGRAELTRSILEGISIEIYDNIRLMEQLTCPIDTVSVAGGMVRSDLFCSIQSSVFNKKVARYKNKEASSLGAAMIAAVTLGCYKDIYESYNNMQNGEPYIFLPNDKDVSEYSNTIKLKHLLYNTLNNQETYGNFICEV